MAKVIGIMGASGSGKTTSMRNLDPKTTFYIDCDKKGLSWKGWRNQYQFEKGNYMATDQVSTVNQILAKINTDEKQKHINVVVIDTLNGLMVADEVRRMKDKGFDKWQDLAQCVWELLDSLYTLRSNLTIIVICHSQTQKDEDGYIWTKIKTSGKKLDKLEIETKLNVVLYATNKDGKYLFETHANNSTTKTPLGAFEEDEIENDILKVLEALKDY